MIVRSTSLIPVFKYIILSGFIAWSAQTDVFAYAIGDRVEANGTVNVRSTPAGTVLGTEGSGSQGAIIGGPTVATLNGTSYTWWDINFDAGVDGWVADIGLISAPPTVQTLSASSITTTSAQLRGSITPNGSSTSAYFQYGTTTGYGSTTTPGNFGTTAQTIGFTVSGLSANATYHYRIVAENGTGTTDGNDVTFTTSPQPVPTVQTLAASSVVLNSATLNGSVNPNGAISGFYFDYGTTTGYGSTTVPGNTTISITVNEPISGLSPNTTYHFRFVASNSGGTTIGSDSTFTTLAQPAPTVQTLAASSVTTVSATLNGSINPNGADTTAYFQYGTSPSFGSSTISGDFGTNSQTIGTSVSALVPGTTYYYRIVAANSGGTSQGGTVTFTTAGSENGPIVETLPATFLTATSAQLNGSLNPNGASTTAYFEYGTTAGYGTSTAPGNFGTTSQNIGYVIPGLAPNQTYHFRLTASNANGVSHGTDATFATGVAPASAPPVIASQPQSQTVQAGANVIFSAAVTGSIPLSYQWLRNSAALPGRTGPTLSLNSVATTDSAGYSVAISNPYGTATSATALLSVYAAPLNSPPASPVTMPTSRTPDQPTLVPVTSAQLEVFSGTAFVSGGSIDPTKMTIVFTHGWRSSPSDWPQAMASNMVKGGITDANLLAWDWSQAADTGPLQLSVAFSATPNQGQALGQALSSTLGSSYGKPIHFIGHSLGTLVNATAANYLHEQMGGAFIPANTHITLLDDAEIAYDEGILVEFGSVALPSLEPLLGQNGIPTVGWVSAVPHHYGWIDNYISLVGSEHPEAVNVLLNQALDRASTADIVTFLTDAHGYPCTWYGTTADQPDISTLGNRYSFERLGFNTSPAEACPYPAGSLFVQDTYPAAEFPLHQPSPLELELIGNREAAALVGYGFLSGIGSLTDLGQTIGNAALNVVTSSAAVVAQGANVTSQFFYSLQAVLNSGTVSQSQAVRKGAMPLDDGSDSGVPGIWMPIQVPTNAVVLSFDFTLTGSTGTDVFTANIDGTNIFALEGQFIPQNQRLNSGAIPVVEWAGQSVELFFGLVGGTSSDATVTVDAMRFYEQAAPSLSISVTNSQATISWPATVQGFALQSADSPDAQWNAVTNTPATNGLWNVVTDSIGGASKFYRLKQ